MTQDVKPAQMFRDVMLYAHETARYRGPGAMWGVVGDSEIYRVLEGGAHDAVLRSEGFCRSFFPEPIVAGIVNNLDARTRWQPHHDTLRTHPDPLAYCWRFLARSWRLSVARCNQDPANIARRQGYGDPSSAGWNVGLA